MKQLLKEFRNGNYEVFEEIFKIYHLPVYYFARIITGNVEEAQEITSDTFMKLWQMRRHFSSQKKIRAFLCITTRNACADYLQDINKATGDLITTK